MGEFIDCVEGGVKLHPNCGPGPGLHKKKPMSEAQPGTSPASRRLLAMSGCIPWNTNEITCLLKFLFVRCVVAALGE